MLKKIVEYRECVAETLNAFDQRRVLLVSLGHNDLPNVMAIGWGSVGLLWRKPMFIVTVRPSRYTHQLIEETGEFTVNVVPAGMAEVVKYCGSVSGRNYNKIEVQHLTIQPSIHLKTPFIKEGTINFECRVVYKNDLVVSELPEPILSGYYAKGDFHRVYFGEILACHRDG
jgi:flavin reductase (DIM6/NTAB) family NADH-FMN oxidoreductase RutF